MSGGVSRKNLTSGIFLFSLIDAVTGNVNTVEQNYTCKVSGVQTIPQIESFQNCQSDVMSINGKVVCNLTGCIPPMINKTAFTGCNIIERHCFYNGIETRLLFKPLLEGAKLNTMSGRYRQGECVRIICSAPENYNAHSFRLTKDGTDTGSSWITTRLTKHTMEFRFHNISMADSGNYSCSYEAEIRNETFNCSQSNIVAINVVQRERSDIEVMFPHLSTGATVWICVGIVAPIIVIVGCVCCKWRQRETGNSRKLKG